MSTARTRNAAAHGRAPAALDPLPELPPIRLPVRVATLEGFHNWYVSGGRVPHARLSYCGGTIFVNLGPEEYMVCIPPGATTLKGFRAWAASEDFPRRGRISFLGDEIFIDMSPEGLENHNKVKEAITRGIGVLNADLDLGELYADRAAVVNARAGLATEPDATFVSYESSEKGRVHLRPARDFRGEFVEVQGTPDWVLEIVSPSSLQADTVEMRDLYYRAGIPEYWIVNALDERPVVQILTRSRKGYVAVRPRDGWYKSRVFPARFRLVRQRNRVGRWKYELQVQQA